MNVFQAIPDNTFNKQNPTIILIIQLQTGNLKLPSGNYVSSVTHQKAT